MVASSWDVYKGLGDRRRRGEWVLPSDGDPGWVVVRGFSSYVSSSPPSPENRSAVSSCESLSGVNRSSLADAEELERPWWCHAPS